MINFTDALALHNALLCSCAELILESDILPYLNIDHFEDNCNYLEGFIPFHLNTIYSLYEARITHMTQLSFSTLFF